MAEAPAPGGEAEPHSPHSVVGNVTLLEQPLAVAGRVLRTAAGVQLADAFAALDLEFDSALALPAHGTLAVARGHWNGRALLGAEWLELQASALPGLPPEFERAHAGVGRRLQLRATVLGEIRRFFLERDFLEVDTPIRARECAIEPHIESLRSAERYLITSPELHMKRLLVAGVPRLFQLVHCFRAEELGPLHAPEFLMLEWYRAFAGWQQLLDDTERLLERLAEQVLGGSELRLPNGHRIDLRPPFLRVSVREAFQRFAGVADAAELAARDEDAFFQLLVDKVEPGLASSSQPVFLYDYPSSQAALARRSPEDPSVAERFELYVGGIELCNGFGELNDAAEQRRRSELDRERCRVLGRHVPPLPEQFLRALEHGMPRASGNALGVDRLVMLLAGESSIDAVRPFPSDEV
jgi:elongation factor P--(R)-beta-lysine ligase